MWRFQESQWNDPENKVSNSTFSSSKGDGEMLDKDERKKKNRRRLIKRIRGHRRSCSVLSK